MARDPSSPAVAADFETLMAQLTALKDEMSRLAEQIGASATQSGKAMSDTVAATLLDAQRYAGHKAHDADVRLEKAIAANPYVAVGLAAGLGLLLGVMTRR
jgi:ElaB/YqjD/DUF883 family membrane-anchored ribosome-binding protein